MEHRVAELDEWKAEMYYILKLGTNVDFYLKDNGLTMKLLSKLSSR